MLTAWSTVRQIRALDPRRLVHHIGTLPPDKVSEIEATIAFILGLPIQGILSDHLASTKNRMVALGAVHHHNRQGRAAGEPGEIRGGKTRRARGIPAGILFVSSRSASASAAVPPLE